MSSPFPDFQHALPKEHEGAAAPAVLGSKLFGCLSHAVLGANIFKYRPHPRPTFVILGFSVILQSSQLSRIYCMGSAKPGKKNFP